LPYSGPLPIDKLDIMSGVGVHEVPKGILQTGILALGPTSLGSDMGGNRTAGYP